jgi:hypothetical protein
MMYESNDTTAAVRDLDRLMLEVKFRIPPLHPSTVRRARLVEHVRVSGCRVVGYRARGIRQVDVPGRMGPDRGSPGRLALTGSFR